MESGACAEGKQESSVFVLRRFLSIAGLACLIASFAACGGGGGSASTTPPTTPPGTTPPSAVSFSVTSLDFGSVASGSSKSLPLTITNTGTASLTITQISASDPQFTVTGLTLPLTLASRQAATGTVTFTPSKTGSTTASFTVTGSSGSLGSLPLTGSTTTVLAHSVDVTWTISSSPGVVSYNVYRSTVSGGPYSKIGAATGTIFTDSTVQSGKTYFYVVTAVDGLGIESVVSGEVTAVVPTP